MFNNIRYFGRGGLRTNRYWIWKQQQAEAQAAIWDDPRGYYFCNIVAISPEAQGKGIGKLLFEAITKRADDEGVKCYLESSKSVPNVAIYERMGFHMSKEMECRDGMDACMVCILYLFCSVWSWGWDLFGLLLTLIVGSCTAWSGIRGKNDPVAFASMTLFGCLRHIMVLAQSRITSIRPQCDSNKDKPMSLI